MIAVFLLGGFALLFAGGELLVRGGVGVALRLNIPRAVVGLTLVAFATSAPELIVSVIAALRGKSDIALGNVIGSNIANVGLILGLTAVVYKMKAHRLSYQKDWYFLLLANAFLLVLLYLGGVPRWGGLLFVLMLIGYNVVKVRNVRRNPPQEPLDIGENRDHVLLSILWLVLGSLALKYGAQFFVGGISSMALKFGLSERIISVTLVAFGTSVPELAASLIAARKGESDLAIGNIIGSNLFNILSVLGITALIRPMELNSDQLFTIDFPVSVLLTALVIPLMGWLKPDRLDRYEGGLLLISYLLYISYLVF